MARFLAACLVFLTLVLATSPTALAEDLVELTSGAKVRGKVTSQDSKEIKVDVVIGSRTISRVYSVDKVAAVTIDGKRQVLGGSGANPPANPGGNAPANPGAGGQPGALAPAGQLRSKAEVESIIKQMGQSPPDWLEATPLNYPQSLDLTWPQPPPGGGWNNQKNVGQYIWDIVNPNPSKWREGVRLLHFLLAENKDRQVQQRIMLALGTMYHNLHEDYARAAFWWRAAGVDKSGGPPGAVAHLAECYWKLGNKQMAVDFLRAQPQQTSAMIKIWADMGETNFALQVAELLARSAFPSMHYLAAGDACRVAGMNSKAIDYYQKVLAVPANGNQKGRIDKDQGRARASLDAIRLFDQLDLRRVPDGTYRDSSLGYETQVEVEVTVAGQRITDVRVVQHREKQFYSALTDTPRKIIAKQGVKGVDATSSATITSEAIINATAKALAAASK